MHEFLIIGNAEHKAVSVIRGVNTAAVILPQSTRASVLKTQAFKRALYNEFYIKGGRTALVCRVARPQPLINNEYQNHYLLLRPSAQPA